MIYKAGEEIILNLMNNVVQLVLVLKDIDTDIVTSQYLRTDQGQSAGDFYNFLVEQGYVNTIDTKCWNVQSSITDCKVAYYL